jgi:hypothetical protein
LDIGTNNNANLGSQDLTKPWLQKF